MFFLQFEVPVFTSIQNSTHCCNFIYFNFFRYQKASHQILNEVVAVIMLLISSWMKFWFIGVISFQIFTLCFIFKGYIQSVTSTAIPCMQAYCSYHACHLLPASSRFPFTLKMSEYICVATAVISFLTIFHRVFTVYTLFTVHPREAVFNLWPCGLRDMDWRFILSLAEWGWPCNIVL
jgi:hypothetical protein